MRYIHITDYNEANRAVNSAFETSSRVHKSVSIRAMQASNGWKRKGQVRCGRYIYNIGPENVQILADRNLIMGK